VIVNDLVITVVVGVLSAGAGGILGWLLNNRFGSRSLEAMRKRGDETLRHARREAAKAKRKAVLDSKEDILRQRNKADGDLRSRKGQLLKRERDLKTEREKLDEREAALRRDEEALAETIESIAAQRADAEEANRRAAELVQEQNERLEAVSGMTRDEARRQLRAQVGRPWPDLAVACVGGGSNAIGLFTAFLEDSRVRMIGVEAGGQGDALGSHAARFHGGRVGILHGTRTLVLQDEDGQIASTHSVSAGLDYPAVGPEHVNLAERGRIEFTAADDAEAIAAFDMLAATEGILPALESAHAIAEVIKRAPRMTEEMVILVNLSGRGDKDVESVLAYKEAAVPREEDHGVEEPAARRSHGPKAGGK